MMAGTTLTYFISLLCLCQSSYQYALEPRQTQSRSVSLAATSSFQSSFSSTQSNNTSSTTATSGPSASAMTRPLGTRAHHGLTQDGMQVNSIYVGFLPDWSRESPIGVNKALGREMAVIGDYVGVNIDNYDFAQISYHMRDLVTLRMASVYHPAILPYFRLSNWTSDMSTALAAKAAQLNKRGITVWLRFAYEMNGDWMSYGYQPAEYISAFRSVHDAVKDNTDANATYMVWSPNIFGGSVDNPLQGYTPYYPGKDYVDIAGLSLYYSGPSPAQNSNVLPSNTLFADLFTSFYNLYSSSHPIIISETSAPYHYLIPSGYDSQGADTGIVGNIPNISVLTPIPAESPGELDLKKGWLQQLLSNSTAARFPRLTNINWFNYFKEGNNTQFVDFRAVGGNVAVEGFFRNYTGNATAYQGGFPGVSAASSRWIESAFLRQILLIVLGLVGVGPYLVL